MLTLEAKIIQANRAYALGTPIISDAEFDALIEQLADGHPLRSYLGERGTASHTHSPKMLSLQKAREETEIKTWMQSFEDDPHVLLLPKLDGVACRIIYVNGSVVGAYTRGDGTTGEDISKAVLRLLSVPEHSPYPKVDGELILDKEAFEKLKLTTNYTMARSAVVGLISRNDSNAAAEAGVRFIAYTAHATKQQKAPDSMFARLQQLGEAGFSVALVYHQCLMSELNWMTLLSVRQMVQNSFVDTDGVVVRIDSMAAFKSLGGTEHHPHGAIALKHPNQTVTTTITGVTFQVGRTGAITPVLEVVPVMVEGAEVARATLHNMKQFREFSPRIGIRAELKRAGSVIPFVVSIEDAGSQAEDFVPIEEPKTCPSCDSPLHDDGTTVFCTAAMESPEQCDDAAVQALCHFSSVIGIEGIGPAIAKALVDDGARRGPDIYVAAKKGKFAPLVGDKTAQSIESEIFAKSELPLSIIIEACGMDRIGKTHAKTIASKCPTIEAQGVLAYFDSLAWADAFGAVESARMKAGYSRRRDIFALALKRIKVKPMVSFGPLSGKGFCFTGEIDIPRTQAEGYVEDLGGVCQGGVSKKTDFLVCAAAEANSTKYKKAISLQQSGHSIKILNGEEFKRMIREAKAL